LRRAPGGVRERRIRLLHLHSSAEVGGTELSSLDLSRQLASNGYEQAVAFLCPPGPVSRLYEQEGFRTSYLARRPAGPRSPLALVESLVGLIRLLTAERFDLVLLYGMVGNAIGRAARLFRPAVPMAGIIRGLTNTVRVARLRLWLDRVSLPMIEVYISNSRRVADDLVAFGFPRTKIRVVPTGIDVDACGPCDRDGAREALGFGLDERLVVCVANLRPVKNHGMLLDACARLWGQGAEFTLLLVGTGPAEERLQRIVRNASWGEHVQFAGSVPDVSGLLAAADLFVLSSHSEGLSRSVLEAMAAGLPVVATDVGGMRELVVPDDTGLLVPPEDSEALSRALERLLGDPGLRARMGAAGRTRVATDFDIATVARQLGDTLEEVVGLRAISRGSGSGT
jgi:glycosyltransferase involved in cell wall biosynthesis